MKLKTILGVVCFVSLFCFASQMDYEAETGTHKVAGTVCNDTILTDNGRDYTVNGFKDGAEVTVELDGQGNILSVKSK